MTQVSPLLPVYGAIETYGTSISFNFAEDIYERIYFYLENSSEESDRNLEIMFSTFLLGLSSLKTEQQAKVFTLLTGKTPQEFADSFETTDSEWKTSQVYEE